MTLANPTIHDFTFHELEARLEADGVKALHARDLFKALYRDASSEIHSHPAVLPPLKRWIEKNTLALLELSRETRSADGCTRKYLLQLHDERVVESVLMSYTGRMTACLSSQVGCAMGCVFCATGRMGFKRHLSTGEIVAQACFVARQLLELNGQPLRNIVMMGMGEPLQNLKPVMEAVEILTDPRGLGIAPGRISISTVGHVPGIYKLAESDANVTLSLSLHAANDEERSKLIPLNKRWPIAELLEACQVYTERKQRKVFVSWTLIAGVNDSDDQARRLGTLLRGRPMHINLIPLNPIDDFAHEAPDDARIKRFQDIVKEASDLPVTVRQRRGIDVSAGCGQLAGK